jgi:hypothetical protein
LNCICLYPNFFNFFKIPPCHQLDAFLVGFVVGVFGLLNGGVVVDVDAGLLGEVGEGGGFEPGLLAGGVGGVVHI